MSMAVCRVLPNAAPKLPQWQSEKFVSVTWKVSVNPPERYSAPLPVAEVEGAQDLTFADAMTEYPRSVSRHRKLPCDVA
jgi:hypothetical protein